MAEITAEGTTEEGRKKDDRSSRPTSLGTIINHRFTVLDHGFVRLIDVMGDDAAIVQAARVSYGSGTKTHRDDEKLIRYLMRHRHTTPFEMCEIKLHVKLPVFVARQWIRHRTASVNEYSARYSILDKEFYVPDRDERKDLDKLSKIPDEQESEAEQEAMFDDLPKEDRVLARQSQSNKQGREGSFDDDQTRLLGRRIHDGSVGAYQRYEGLLQGGVAREMARVVLPMNMYTQWYWKCNLHNLFHFLHLRDSAHAQWEIREYARIISEKIVAHWVPIAWQAYCDYRRGEFSLSHSAIQVVRAWLQGEKVDPKTSGLSDREWRELHAALYDDQNSDA